ncbi:hypothetical protein SAMN04488128_1021249 [Chitinophaga eiseniae]|uniref:Holin-X, holin superfamily III n=1 Tax=Chitinophaga eiseniae TaxID=634771 RepID=A0A1T4RKK7_9BACT|nr:hypothetical protein [Chitinophaga eiseniae]SKA16469.1 hypothetical protein SAMN04488128_1021249 [Chitinophaga eiseniae]
MEENFGNYFNQTGKVAREYLETRLDLLKLQAAGKLSKALGLFFSLTMAFLLFFFVIVFLGMVVGFWIGEMTGSFTIGFACAAGLFVLLFVVILLFRRQLIQRPLTRLLLTELVEEISEADEQSGHIHNQPGHNPSGRDQDTYRHVPNEEATENTSKG